jgi:ribosomal protein S18 acetylase RimI-like enzyme
MMVRALTSEDAAQFFALRLRGLKECPSAFASSFEEEADTPLAEIAIRLSPTSDRAVMGAYEEGKLVAIVGLQRETMVKLSHKAFVWGMYVAPEARGRGVGLRVLRAALDHAAKQLRVDQVNLGVNTKNVAAVTLYKNAGFVEYGLEKDFLRVNGESHDEYQMVCKVATTLCGQGKPRGCLDAP